MAEIKDIRNSRPYEDYMPADAGEHAEDLLDILQRMKGGYWPSLDVSAGWYELIIELNKALARIDPNYSVDQVKGKSGGLRYYFKTKSNHFAEMAKLVAAAEENSFFICETCGAPSKRAARDRMAKVACKAHASKERGQNNGDERASS
jgi:hypothetical protein